MKRVVLAAGMAVLGFLGAGEAEAHVFGAWGGGLGGGFFHPLGGLDHVLAMVAVGLWAAQLGGRALWALPAAFLSMMAVGGLVGGMGLSLPWVEAGIAASVAVMGLAVAWAVRWPMSAGLGLVGLFALFHGHAHGAEIPQAAAPALYAAGFLAATALLHGTGIALGRLAASGPIGAKLLRGTGAAVAAASLLLWAAA
jgi:urease accessory protein